MIRLRALILGIAMTGAISACQKHFDFALYTTSEATFNAALLELNEGSSYAAAEAFERLTTQLAARDTLLPKAYWYLGVAQMKNKEWLAASNAFRQIHARFSTDSLADDGLLAAARASMKLWPDPELDSTYGEDAKSRLATLLQSYPNSSLREEAFRELDALDEMFATKLLEVAKGYYRHKADYSAITYAKEAIELYPATRTSREARMLIVRSSRRLKGDPDSQEQCQFLRELYRGDKEVLELCGAAPPPAAIPS